MKFVCQVSVVMFMKAKKHWRNAPFAELPQRNSPHRAEQWNGLLSTL